MKPRLISIGVSVPKHAATQKDIKEYVAPLFAEGLPAAERFLTVFDHGLIEKRHFAMPLEWYRQEHSFTETNVAYCEVALELAEEAAVKAICGAGISREQVAGIVFVSSTGIATPTLEAMLITRLGLPLDTIRVPLWGLGCAGGASGIARGAELARVQRAGKVILLVAVELCSLTFQNQDLTKANLVGASLFADGAAAAIFSLQGEGPEIYDSFSILIPDSQHIMGWDIVNTGLKVRFSREIPNITRMYLPRFLQEACNKWQIATDEIRHYVVHPGGAKVLEAYQESLDLQQAQLISAYDILRQYGNMSSASILFVMEDFLKKSPAKEEWGILVALGPGFCAELVLFRW